MSSALDFNPWDVLEQVRAGRDAKLAKGANEPAPPSRKVSHFSHISNGSTEKCELAPRLDESEAVLTPGSPTPVGQQALDFQAVAMLSVPEGLQAPAQPQDESWKAILTLVPWYCRHYVSPPRSGETYEWSVIDV